MLARPLASLSETAPPDDERWKESLKRCAAPTLTAADLFRRTGNPRYLPVIVRGVLALQVGPDGAEKLAASGADPRLSEDLGIDSLARMELALALEDAVGCRLEDEELRRLATVGQIERALAARARAASAGRAKS